MCKTLSVAVLRLARMQLGFEGGEPASVRELSSTRLLLNGIVKQVRPLRNFVALDLQSLEVRSMRRVHPESLLHACSTWR